MEVVDEVIAEHPAPPLSPFSPGSKLAARGPVHTALTASIRSHFLGLPASQQAAEGMPGGNSDAETPSMPQVEVLWWQYSQTSCFLFILMVSLFHQ